jgi:hypothetical protein
MGCFLSTRNEPPNDDEPDIIFNRLLLTTKYKADADAVERLRKSLERKKRGENIVWNMFGEVIGIIGDGGEVVPKLKEPIKDWMTDPEKLQIFLYESVEALQSLSKEIAELT